MFKHLDNLAINILNTERLINAWWYKSLNKRQLTNNASTNNLVKYISVWKKNMLHKCVQLEEGETINYLSKKKERKCSKTNLFAYLCFYNSLIRVTRIIDRKEITSIKQYGKNENKKKNIIKNIFAAFSKYEIWNLHKHINVNELYYLAHQFILPPANLNCHFHILFMYRALYFPTFIFALHVPCFSFLLIDHNRKQVLLI